MRNSGTVFSGSCDIWMIFLFAAGERSEKEKNHA